MVLSSSLLKFDLADQLLVLARFALAFGGQGLDAEQGQDQGFAVQRG